jgi:hypothetical protein
LKWLDYSLFGGLVAGFSFFLVSARFLLGHVEDLIVLEFLTGVGDRQKDSLSGSLEEFALLELQLTLELLSLHIGDEEGGDEILNQDLRLVLLLFNLVEELVDGFDLELGLVIGLEGRGGVNSLSDNVLQVRIDRALVDTHQLLVEDIFSFAEDLFGLTATRFLSLTSTSLIFGEGDHGSDTALLLQTDKLLREVVHGLGDDGGLEGFGDSIDDTLLVVVNQVTFLRKLGVLTPFFGQSQLSDQIKTFLLALEHAVLLSTSTEESL